jgi:ATP-dependent helicase/nuclease subunit B
MTVTPGPYHRRQMSLRATIVSPARALDALAAAIRAAKGDDRLAAVTVAVPTNICGVMARRALGRNGGVAAVDMVTVNRLAELIAGPLLAAAGRSPVSTAIVDRAIAAELAAAPGIFRPVADHPSTIVALRRLHVELRLAGDAALQALDDASGRAREAARVSRGVAARLAADWYDEADLFALATDTVRRAAPAGLRQVVVYLPNELPPRSCDFVRALGAVLDVHVVVQRTGDPDADRDSVDLLGRLGAGAAQHDPSDDGSTARTRAAVAPARIVSTTDADDEVRTAVRVVVDQARAGVALERMAILWPAQRPYARLVEHHLDAAGIRWNGRPGTVISERLAPRLALDLLDLDRRGLRRRDLFDLLADIPPRDDDGTRVPRRRWEQVSRQAGVARGDDWNRRLGPLTAHERWGEPATTLREFVDGLRGQLGHPSATRTWAAWSTWCNENVEHWLGRATLDHLDDAEFRAWEALGRALDRLGHLDAIADPVTRRQFRLTLQAELDEVTPRVGRVGDGVTVAPLAGAVGLDVDVAVVLGGAEGVLPPRPVADPLLSERDRTAAGLATTEARAIRLHRQYRSVLASAATTVTYPRGDLRATSSLLPSRWLATSLDDAAEPAGVTVERIASHHAALERATFPATDAEHRLRGRYVHARAGGHVMTAPGATADVVVARGTAVLAARRTDTLTAYDGDLSGCAVPVHTPTSSATCCACARSTSPMPRSASPHSIAARPTTRCSTASTARSSPGACHSRERRDGARSTVSASASCSPRSATSRSAAAGRDVGRSGPTSGRAWRPSCSTGSTATPRSLAAAASRSSPRSWRSAPTAMSPSTSPTDAGCTSTDRLIGSTERPTAASSSPTTRPAGTGTPSWATTTRRSRARCSSSPPTRRRPERVSGTRRRSCTPSTA